MDERGLAPMMHARKLWPEKGSSIEPTSRGFMWLFWFAAAALIFYGRPVFVCRRSGFMWPPWFSMDVLVFVLVLVVGR